MAPPPPSHPAQPPEPPFLQTPVELLEEIFLRLPTAEDLARASTACASFHRVIGGHGFLRRYRVLHRPPLIGMFHKPFLTALPPHPSALAARAFADFDFSCSSFLPSTAGRAWSPIDFFDGRALLDCTPVEHGSGSAILVGPDGEVCDFQYREFLVRDLAVCDPVHRRYVLLPAVPGNLKAMVHRSDLLGLETFLAPGDDEEDPLSFRVMCLAECRMHLLLLVFSSLDGQWQVHTYCQWNAKATFASFEKSESGLSYRRLVHGSFCWNLHFLNKLLLLDKHTLEFSAVNLPPERIWRSRFVIVEAAEGALGRLTIWYDQYSEYGSYILTYCVLRNNHWKSEKVIPLPISRAILIGVAGGYLLIEGFYTTPSQGELSQEALKFGYFSVDLKTLQVELFAGLSKSIFPGRLYAGFPPSLRPPTV
ncbi:hypothetical protein CFC21_106876 [Triticum aestivum]|uniref:F-box domain-containing protein n=3 Tax=Triticum aestivum TaxID=4565 RepID=A0A3B6THQ8_WHEAT|nr:hypothetical protein CFC21_106876 [Triticum aestivum]